MTAPDIDSLDTYGGALANYSPVTDPETDQDADAMNQCKASTAAMTHTASRCWARFISGDTFVVTPDFTSQNSHDSMWGSLLAVRPVLARTGTGVYTLTWPSTVTDELGVSHALNLRWATASFENQAAFASAEVTAVNVVTIRLFNTGGAAADFNGKVVLVRAG